MPKGLSSAHSSACKRRREGRGRGHRCWSGAGSAAAAESPAASHPRRTCVELRQGAPLPCCTARLVCEPHSVLRMLSSIGSCSCCPSRRMASCRVTCRRRGAPGAGLSALGLARQRGAAAAARGLHTRAPRPLGSLLLKPQQQQPGPAPRTLAVLSPCSRTSWLTRLCRFLARSIFLLPPSTKAMASPCGGAGSAGSVA